MITHWDRALFQSINNGFASPALDLIMPRITDLGLGHVQALLLILAAVIAGRRGATRQRQALARGIWDRVLLQKAWLVPSLLAIVLAGAGVQALKRIPRQRPSWFYTHEHVAGRSLDVHVHTINGRRPLRVNGFPSGHTATTAAIAMALGLTLPAARLRRRAAVAIAAMTLLIGLSRVYMADHWPLDVLGGMGVGVLSGWLAVQLTSRWFAIGREHAVSARSTCSGGAE